MAKRPYRDAGIVLSVSSACPAEIDPNKALGKMADLLGFSPYLVFLFRCYSDPNPHANKLMVHMLATFAEHERDQISARTKAALAAAKARGVKLGGPKLAEAQTKGQAAQRADANKRAVNVMPSRRR